MLFELEDTNLPPGVYLLQRITVLPENPSVLPQTNLYHARDPDELYLLTVSFAAEFGRSCLSDIRAAGFVVAEATATT